MQSAAERQRCMFNELLELRPLLADPTTTDLPRPISILSLRQPKRRLSARRISARNSFTLMWSLHLKRKKQSVVHGALASIAPASALW